MKGVAKTASNVTVAVKETDKAVFPFANSVMKLEVFPPGQAATRNIPNARGAEGFITITSKVVRAGNKISCDVRPTITDFGFDATCLKALGLRSRATPNMINPKQTLRKVRLSGEKLRVI